MQKLSESGPLKTDPPVRVRRKRRARAGQSFIGKVERFVKGGQVIGEENQAADEPPENPAGYDNSLTFRRKFAPKSNPQGVDRENCDQYRSGIFRGDAQSHEETGTKPF